MFMNEDAVRIGEESRQQKTDDVERSEVDEELDYINAQADGHGPDLVGQGTL